MIYDPEFETISKDELEQLQVERLQTTLQRVYRNVSFYKENFDKNRIDITGIKSLDDLRHFPFTTIEDLRKSYPYDAFAVPLREIVRIHTASDMTGQPIVLGYTKNDINTWTRLIARVLSACGITDHDVVQIAYNYNLISGGFGFLYGAEKIGASVIPITKEDIRKQLLVMKDFKITALISTPGYALHLANTMDELKVHPDELFLKTFLLGTEPWSEKLREELETRLYVRAFDNYGLNEVFGPGIAYECSCHCGLHINEDHFLVEVIDPRTLEPLNFGEKGELVFTTLTKEGFPLIRYRTGDITALIPGKCSCDRTLTRIERICGRTDDMIIIEGVNVFPSQIEALLAMGGITPRYLLIIDREEGIDTLTIEVEVMEDIPFIDEMRHLQNYLLSIEEKIHTELGIRTRITLREPRALESSLGGGVKRIIDRRKI